jgi:hypothetical protein
MGTEIVRVGENRIYPATKAVFGDVDVIVVQYGGLYQRICLGSIEQALPGIQGTPEWQRFIGSQEVLEIAVDGGKPFRARVIPKSDFFNAALSHPRCAAFRAEVAKLLERLDNVGVVVGPDVPSTPLIKSLQSQLELAIAQERQARELERQGKELQIARTRADDAYNLAETSIELQTRFRGRLIAIAELGRRGWMFPQGTWQRIGMEMRALSLRVGDEPANYKRPWNGLDVNTYREDVFDLWEQEYGPNYRQYRKKAVVGGA